MVRKSPRRVRDDLEAARRRIGLLVGVLRENAGERRWGLGDECTRAAENLARLLTDNETPRDYKVAVIGRFKAGKSSFINELLGHRLAGVDTSPETAAITTFRAGEMVVAKINLVDKGTWDDLKALHKEDATNPEAHRVATWHRFDVTGQRSASTTSPETFDLDTIEREHVRTGGHTLTISLPSAVGADAKRRAENEFRRRIKQYTSSTKPHHCLVESIEIETPSSILGEGVILVDTPGLDDTERFRVQLTERAVQDVDAVLFLTKSGASYGQSEKDFLLSLLRKGSIKQLIFVVTQVDQTYEQHVRQARDQDEDPEPISERIAVERRRVRTEVEATLDELAGATGSPSMDKYRDQLSDVEISFTSAANHRDHVRGDPVRFPIRQDDAGGMRQVKETLYQLLSTESRLAASTRAIRDGAASVLQDMLSVIEKRRLVVSGLGNREVAEQKLATFRSEFEQNGGRFTEVIEADATVLESSLANRAESGRLTAEIISLQADEVLGSYEADDAGRHWRTRRGGNWGYMHEVQARIANRIFPKVAEQLNKQTTDFGNFVDAFRAHLQILSDEAGNTIRRLEIGDELQLDIGSNLTAFLDDTLRSLQELVEGEETRIVALLENFVDEQVEAKITEARERVTSVWGRGTTVGQTGEVRAFYRDVRAILRAALQAHIMTRFQEFATHLESQAAALPERAMSQVRAQIERASVDIRAAAEAAIEGQKEAFGRTATTLVEQITAAQAEILVNLVDHATPDEIAVSLTDALRPPQTPSDSLELDTKIAQPGDASIPFARSLDVAPASIQARATLCIKRHTLVNGEKGWPLTRIFAREYLAGASELWLIDPYLALRHQRRNLTEFVIAVIAASKPKTLHIITREVIDGSSDADKAYYDILERNAFEEAGLRIVCSLDSGIHDRFLVLNNGFVFKLGRGLDIYKPVAGLASRDSGLRQVRSCEIDIFAPEKSST